MSNKPLYYDLHVHSQYSDGSLPLEEVVNRAKEQGYGLGIGDHIFNAGNHTVEEISRYLKAASQRDDILVGVEANAGENYRLSDELEDLIDYVVASVHFLKSDTEEISFNPYFFYKTYGSEPFEFNYDVSRTYEYLDWVYDVMKWTMENMRIDILGHPTVNPMHEFAEDRDFVKAWDERVIDLCIEHGVAIEISNLWKQPDEDFVAQALEKGAMFSLASDGHLPEEVCRLDYPISIIEKLSIPQERLFVPKKK